MPFRAVIIASLPPAGSLSTCLNDTQPPIHNVESFVSVTHENPLMQRFFLDDIGTCLCDEVAKKEPAEQTGLSTCQMPSKQLGRHPPMTPCISAQGFTAALAFGTRASTALDDLGDIAFFRIHGP